MLGLSIDDWFNLSEQDLSRLIVEENWTNKHIELASLVLFDEMVSVLSILELSDSIPSNVQKRFRIVKERVVSKEFLDNNMELSSILSLSPLDDLVRQEEDFIKERENIRREGIKSIANEIFGKYEEEILHCHEIILLIDEMVVQCLENIPGLALYRIKNLTHSLTIETLPHNHLTEIGKITDWVMAHELFKLQTVADIRKKLVVIIEDLSVDFESLTFVSEDLDMIYGADLDIENAPERIELEILLGCNTWWHGAKKNRASPEVIVLWYIHGLVNSILTKAGAELGGISFKRGKSASRTSDDPLYDGDIFHRPGHSSGGRYGSQFY